MIAPLIRHRKELGQSWNSFFKKKGKEYSFTDRSRCNMKKNSSIG